MNSLPTHAPRCLDGFRVHHVEPTDVGLPSLDDFTSFALKCLCGCETWHVLGNWFGETPEEAPEFVGPLFATCSHCGSKRRIINRATDGHNAEIGDGDDEDEDAEATWSCRECGAAEGRLIASFGYQFEPDEVVARRRHDYFDVFFLHHNCIAKKSYVRISMFDCA